MELEPKYFGIIKTELVTDEVLRQVSMSPEPENRTVAQLRKTVDGAYCLIKSSQPIIGVLIVDPNIELAKPEWNPVEDEFFVKIEFSIWKPSTWPIFN